MSEQPGTNREAIFDGQFISSYMTIQQVAPPYSFLTIQLQRNCLFVNASPHAAQLTSASPSSVPYHSLQQSITKIDSKISHKLYTFVINKSF